jgi:dienelactone hydrolase
MYAMPRDILSLDVRIPLDTGFVDANLTVPGAAIGLIIFAHGSGSSRFSSRNRAVARYFEDAHLATLLIDLLKPEEERRDEITAEFRFDIPRLARRLVQAIRWSKANEHTKDLPLGLFGASTGAAAALVAAAECRNEVAAVVSRGGRPDLARIVLPSVQAPTLLIVGSHDVEVLELNRLAAGRMTAPVRIQIVPGATHLFEEPGALAQVAELSTEWFTRHLSAHGTNHLVEVPA